MQSHNLNYLLPDSQAHAAPVVAKNPTSNMSVCSLKEFLGLRTLELWLISKMKDLWTSPVKKVIVCRIWWVNGWVERSALSYQRNVVSDKPTSKYVPSLCTRICRGFFELQDMELASANHEVERNVALMKTNFINVDYTLSAGMCGNLRVPETSVGIILEHHIFLHVYYLQRIYKNFNVTSLSHLNTFYGVDLMKHVII